MAPTVFITGTSSGVGLATTHLFLEKGWNVVATARNPGTANDLQAITSSPFGQALLIVTLDLLDQATIQPAVEAALARFSRIDCLINNAGYAQYNLVEQATVEDIRKQFEVNVVGPISLIKIMLPHLREAGKAGSNPVVVNVSSGAAHFGLPLTSLYNASKAALDMFTEGVQFELAALEPPIPIKVVVPHGGIQSTNFGASLGAGMKTFQSDAEIVKMYGAFVQRSVAKFMEMSGHSMTVETAAQAVWTAATDGTTRLRYFVAAEGAGANLQRRMQGAAVGESLDSADAKYVDYMRAQFRTT
ncbi:NAD(P)-binding protein [Thozetella sp. PMI_491]|nr:NAD(P)-binding protein [Thozetella sp. PMI_491]